MINLIGKLSNKISNLFGQSNANGSRNAEQVKLWFSCKGDQTLRLDYPLTENSLVMDLGGYKGDWTHDIFVKYHPRILVFEPILSFHKTIATRFKNNSKIQVFPFGLSSKTEIAQFSMADNGSSVFDVANRKVSVQLKSITELVNERKIEMVDLIKINIEGGEYDLLDIMIRENIIHRFKNIQVQFHDFFPEARERMTAIQKHLSKTHELTYQFEFVWENWKLKQ